MKTPLTGKYSQTDYGTERVLTVTDADGRVVGQCDPFANGIPLDPTRRRARLKVAMNAIIDSTPRRKFRA